MTEIAQMLQTLQHIQANLAAVEASIVRIEEMLRRLTGTFGVDGLPLNVLYPPPKDLP